MSDVEVYSQFEKYLSLQMKRPDYFEAMSQIVDFSLEFFADKTDVSVSDFCCGVGNITKAFSEKVPISKATLIDINNGFLQIAKETLQNIKLVDIVNKDILQVEFSKTSDLVLSVFAYHHIKDSDKSLYVNQIKNALKENGIVVLAEIFFNSKEKEESYYEELYQSIPDSNKSDELHKFLSQTAKSKDFEYKVSKKYTDEIFAKNGFKLLKEVKIWPPTSDDEGMYIQILGL